MAAIRTGHSRATAAVRHLQSTETSHANPQCLASSDMDVPGSLEHRRGADLIAITRLQRATAETRKHHAPVASGQQGLRRCLEVFIGYLPNTCGPTGYGYFAFDGACHLIAEA